MVGDAVVSLMLVIAFLALVGNEIVEVIRSINRRD